MQLIRPTIPVLEPLSSFNPALACHLMISLGLVEVLRPLYNLSYVRIKYLKLQYMEPSTACGESI